MTKVNEPPDLTIKDWIIGTIIFVVGVYVLYWGYNNIYVGGRVDYSKEEVREKIEEHLYEKYGEEFVVNRIGKRSSRGDKFYQAQIYPKSFEGTNKRWDDYYHASASVEITMSGELGGVGDSYSYVVRNMDVEEYLLPETKEIFGERVLLKVDVEHQITGDGSWWAGYKSKSLEEMREAIEDDPERNRIMLDLDVYVFDRIEDEQEKEEGREDIFKFIQYLKEEGLFEYLEMRVVVVDERVLAPSYDEFEQEISETRKIRKKIEEEDTTVRLPPKDLRERMSRELQLELNEMSEEELLNNMKEIAKEELNYKGIGKWNCHYQAIIYSEGMLKEKYPTSLEKHPEVLRDYEEIEDVKIGSNLEYVYIN